MNPGYGHYSADCPAVSVVVPVRNSARTLPDCLLALRGQSYPHECVEVIVVDDGSRDATSAVATRFGVRCVRISPSGPAAARNRGIEASSGEIIAFTDGDCAPEPGWLEEMIRPFDDPAVTATKGVYRTEQRSWTARFVQAEYESRYRLMARLEEIDFVDTYAAAYRRSALEAVGGFDESFPLPSVEDQELSFRLAAHGARMVFCPRAVVSHRHAADAASYFRKKVKIGFWKMGVLARYPQKAVSDSHTPSNLKLEILLVAAMLPALAAWLATGMWIVPAIVAVLFAAATAPLCLRILARDPVVGLVAPIFLILRAVALGTGMFLGLVRGQFKAKPVAARLRATREEERVVEHV